MIVAEARLLFECQRQFASPHAGKDFERAYFDSAFAQRPQHERMDQVGDCPLLDPLEQRPF
ncbi:MAG: hypothetical protein HQL37_13465, partial [Alphaproteobacteria bacterium]|nr:hypothetical protein [Alphaproteobacteria bacterium]